MLTAEEVPVVNYYELLTLPAHAEVESIRKRISALYLEAQQNLDHSNFRKRFYYNELYEIHLPQARLALLDNARRAEYDAYLRGRETPSGQNSEPQYQPAPATAVTPLPETQVAETQVAGTQAAPPEQDDEPSTEELLAELSQIAWPTQQPVPRRAERPEWMRMDASVVEQRRDFKRRELIKHELIAAGLRWGIGGGIASVFVAVAALLLLHALIRQAGVVPLGLSPPWFNFLSFVLTLVFSFVVARLSLRHARRQIVAVLSKMPYEQLLLRCAR